MLKRKKKFIIRLFLIIAVLFAVVLIIRTIPNHKTATVKYGWNLIMVSENHFLPDDYTVELTELKNGKKVDSRIYPYLQKMFDDMRAEGIYPTVREGYRTAEEQQEIMENKIQYYIDEGLPQKLAKEMAQEWVATPGTSEHELGLALDINADAEKSSSEDVYNWLHENAHKYGFILRYPDDKVHITGIGYEPWHYRYVGTEAAEYIYENGLCLEEYIELIK